MTAFKHLLIVDTVGWVVLIPLRSMTETGRKFGEGNLAEAKKAEEEYPLPGGENQHIGADRFAEAFEVERVSPLVQNVWKPIELDRLATAIDFLLKQSPAIVSNEHWYQLRNLQGRIRSTENEKERLDYDVYEVARNKQRACLITLCMEIFSDANLAFR